MNKFYFRGIVLATLAISVASTVLVYFYPSETVSAFYSFYTENYTIVEPSTFISLCFYISTALMLVSIVGLLVFWNISRYLYVVSYIIMLPAYFYEPQSFYSPLGQVFYDIGMIGSGVILAIIFLEPINGLFNKKSNKALNADSAKNAAPVS